MNAKVRYRGRRRARLAHPQPVRAVPVSWYNNHVAAWLVWSLPLIPLSRGVK